MTSFKWIPFDITGLLLVYRRTYHLGEMYMVGNGVDRGLDLHNRRALVLIGIHGTETGPLTGYLGDACNRPAISSVCSVRKIQHSERDVPDDTLELLAIRSMCFANGISGCKARDRTTRC